MTLSCSFEALLTGHSKAFYGLDQASRTTRTEQNFFLRSESCDGLLLRPSATPPLRTDLRWEPAAKFGPHRGLRQVIGSSDHSFAGSIHQIFPLCCCGGKFEGDVGGKGDVVVESLSIHVRTRIDQTHTRAKGCAHAR